MAKRALVEREPYSIVLRRIWGDEKFRTLSKNGKLMFLYFLTGPDCTVIPGLLTKMGLGTLCDRLDEKYPAVAKAWKEIELKDMARADWQAQVIWLPKGIIHNPPANQFVVTNWRNIPLPECALIRQALGDMRARLACRPSKELVAAFDRIYRQQFPDVVGQSRDGVGDHLEDSVEDGPRLPLDGTGDGDGDGVQDGVEDGPRDQDQDQQQDQDRTPVAPVPRGLNVSTRKPSQAEENWAETVRRGIGRCPHGDCESAGECIGRLVMERRLRIAQGMRNAIDDIAEAS